MTFTDYFNNATYIDVYAGVDANSGDIAVYAFTDPDTGKAFVEIVTAESCTDPVSGDEYPGGDRIIRMTPTTP